jgi:hypothetical protein
VPVPYCLGHGFDKDPPFGSDWPEATGAG